MQWILILIVAFGSAVLFSIMSRIGVEEGIMELKREVEKEGTPKNRLDTRKVCSTKTFNFKF